MCISSVYILCYLKSSSPAKAISEAKLDTLKVPLEKKAPRTSLARGRRNNLSIDSRLFLGSS